MSYIIYPREKRAVDCVASSIFVLSGLDYSSRRLETVERLQTFRKCRYSFNSRIWQRDHVALALKHYNQLMRLI